MSEKNILFIYEDISLRDYVMEIIHTLDCRAIGAASFREGLAKSYACHPHLVLVEGSECERVLEYFQGDPFLSEIPVLPIVFDSDQKTITQRNRYLTTSGLPTDLKQVLGFYLN